MLDRRQWLGSVAGLPLAAEWLQAATSEKLPVAAVVTEYRTNTHADVIVGKVLEGYDQQGGPGPALQVASLYTDQVRDGELSRGLAEKHGFPIAKTIDEAITGGTDDVQVAAVLSVGEHGQYPYTEDTKQHMYPRRRFFDEITASFERTGSVVPVFNDKHLAYNWRDAKHMYDTARRLKIPFMAGSSLPVCYRHPAVTLSLGCEIEEALAIGYGGFEAYGFHALETLQCMIERRRGGETGVAAVQAVRGDGIESARKEGRWSRELFDAALATMPDVADVDVAEQLAKAAAVYCLEHHDGLKSSVVMANGIARHFGFACKLRGRKEPVASWFRLTDEPFEHFEFLLRAINHMVHTGEPAYPVERTLLTTGVLDRIMHSLADGDRRYATPELAIEYQPTDWEFANRH